MLQLLRVTPLSVFYDDMRAFWRHIAWGVGFATPSMLLSAGIYAMMSFTLAQRTREIGIRSALGAHPRRILLGVFGRAAGQLALGVLIASLLSGALVASSSVGPATAAILVGCVALIMMTVGLLAAVGPARRSLRIHTSEALRTGASVASLTSTSGTVSCVVDVTGAIPVMPSRIRDCRGQFVPRVVGITSAI